MTFQIGSPDGGLLNPNDFQKQLKSWYLEVVHFFIEFWKLTWTILYESKAEACGDPGSVERLGAGSWVSNAWTVGGVWCNWNSSYKYGYGSKPRTPGDP